MPPKTDGNNRGTPGRTKNKHLSDDVIRQIAETYKQHGYSAAVQLQTQLNVSRHIIVSILGGYAYTEITGLPTHQQRYEINGGKPFKRGELAEWLRKQEQK